MPKLNKVKDRLIYLSPTVQAGWEDESNISDFEVMKNLGQGAFGKVYKVVHKKSRLVYAIKEMSKAQLKSNNMVEQVANEVKIMYSLNNENIIKLYNHFEDDKNIYLIIEFASGGQLYQNLFKQPGKRFGEKTVAKYIEQLIDALGYIHSKKIVHRDIKPENILIDGSDNIKLADFGWSNFLKPDVKRNTFCGTLDYLAPEMIEKGHKHDEGVDIWSVGVLTYELLSGTAPFSPFDLTGKKQEEVEDETKNNIKNVKFTFPKDFSSLAKDFVLKILVKDLSLRMSIAEMKSHPWITTTLESGNAKPKLGGPKYDELYKKDIGQVSIASDEMADKSAAETFSSEEIMKYSRPDSIINKDYHDDFKTLPNYNKNEIKFSGFDSPESDSKGQIINKLNNRIKELETRNNELEIICGKKANEKDAYKDLTDKITKLEEDKLFSMNKVKLLEEKLGKSKAELDSTWKSLVEKEKATSLLQNEVNTKEEALNKSEKQKKKYKEEVVVLEQKLKDLQAENDELRLKFDGKNETGEKKGELLDQFDDYLEKLKKKHMQELNELTKK